MSGLRRPGLSTRSETAWLAVCVSVVCAVLQLASMWFVAGHRADVVAVLSTNGLAIAAAVGAAWVLDWDRLPREALLGFPLLSIAAGWSLGRVAPHVAVAYAGLLVLVFLYVGLTQRRWVSLAFLPPAATAWASMQDHPFDGQLRVRLSIAVVIWTVLGEILAWKMAELGRQQAALQAAAHRDVLTGLDNRHALPAALAAYVPETALVMIDIDHFKKLNDTHGHVEGDRALQDFAHVLAAVLRTGDSAFRYGGEEFLVIAPRTGVDGAERLLARITMAWNAARPEITFSAGVATWAEDEPHEEALRRADGALYAAKAAGRNRWHVAGRDRAADHHRTMVEPDNVAV